jgi:predicted transposase YbfD/YdcC
MDAAATPLIPRAFTELPDPRSANHMHRFLDILTIAILAVISGAEGWSDVAHYGQSKKEWLATFLELPAGIPSHDTFDRVFSLLDPAAFERCFRAWIASLVQLGNGQLIALDGKSLRRSFANGWDKSGMAHMVSAFVQANHMVFAQVKTDGKGHELDGIQKLLAVLDLQGSVVTIDALGCNKEIAQMIVEGGGDYLLQVKDNQPTLHAQVQTLVQEALLEDFKGFSHDRDQTVDGGHGRIETRRVWVTWNVEHLGKLAGEWPGLKSIVAVECTREINGHVSKEWHYYISSLDRRRKASTFLAYTRGHWSVENNLHWHLDVSFNEDQRRIRKGNGAENFSRLCRLALNLLKNEKTRKVGIKIKRHLCGWDNEYLLKVLAG